MNPAYVSREEIVKEMSLHLVAAILHRSLNTSSEMEVIDCLMEAPERYNSRVVLDHMDDALKAAKQILDQRETANV